MITTGSTKKYDERHLSSAFAHAKELSFNEQIDTALSDTEERSKTANLLGEFYYSADIVNAKASATKILSAELQQMRERLQWSLTPTKTTLAPDEYQTQLAKSRVLSMVLVLRRIMGKFQFNQKKRAFKQWVEWLKAFLTLYRSRPHIRDHSASSRSVSPNSTRSVKFWSSDNGSVFSSNTQRSRNYHFHGDRQKTPEQVRKELYLHKDIYLTSNDDDAEQAVMHRIHAHAANHPEQEYRSPHSPQRHSNSRKPDIKHAHAVVPSHIVSKHGVSSDASTRRSAGSAVSSVITSASTASRQRISNLAPSQLRKDLHLHHDIFLTSEDDIADAVLHRAHPHPSNHPEREFRDENALRRSSAKHQPVPSHVVSKQRGRSLSPTRTTSAASHRNATHSANHNNAERNLSPSQLRKELHLHHDMFLTSEDDIADAVLHRVHPHSPHHPDQAALSRFASPKRRASMRIETQKKASSGPVATVPSHVVPKRPQSAGGSRPPSPSRSAASSPGKTGDYHFHGERNLSPTQLRKELYLHHDMFLTSQDDIADAVLHRVQPHSPNRPFSSPQCVSFGTSGNGSAAAPGGAPRMSSRCLDTLAGSRKDAKLLLQRDAASHIRAIASGKHHAAKASKAITPSLYSSGAAPTGLRAFNVSNDKKHAPKPRVSHSPSRKLAEEHAAKVGIQVDQEELRPGSPTRTLTRALSILATPASDALTHDHRVKPEEKLKRTLTALTMTGHTAIVGAVVAKPEDGKDNSRRHSNSEDDSSDYSSSDEEAEVVPDSRLSILDITKGLSIRIDQSTACDSGSVTSGASTTPVKRRASFHSPTVSHILKLAHRSDSVEKVASKVAQKRATFKQTLPRSPDPRQSFTIIPEELVAQRIERRTSFRSPTRSHSIKVAEKLGVADDTTQATGGSPRSSPTSPAQRRSIGGSELDRDQEEGSETGMYSIRTFIPFTGANPAKSPALARVPSAAALAAAALARSASAQKLIKRGSIAGGMTARRPSFTYSNSFSVPNTTQKGSNEKKNKSPGSGVKFSDGDSVTLDSADDCSLAVYDVSDSLDNLFDATTPPFKRGKSMLLPSGKKVKVGGAKHEAHIKQLAEERNTGALDRIFRVLNVYHGKVGRTTTTKAAFAAWKSAAGWLRKIDERVPQSILYLLQVEKEVLWRVFCVYCPEKHRIPVSPPNTVAATSGLSPETIQRLSSGHSPHRDHHTRPVAVLHHHETRVHPQQKEVPQALIRRDLHLHRDIFLNTDDDDVTELQLLKNHRHASNHPEEGVVVHHHPIKRDVSVPIPHHEAVVHPHQQELDRKKLHKELHLHHDMFLTSVDEDIEALALQHSHPHSPNHPEKGVIVTHDGELKRPSPIHSPRSPRHSWQSPEAVAHNPQSQSANSPRQSPAPRTPLYGLFTVIEEDPNQSVGPSPVPRLHYGSPTFLDTSLSREAPPAQLGQTPPHAVPQDMVLQISHPSPCPTNTLGLPPAEAVAVQACTRFRKHLLDLDGLWHLFQDFNVVPYLLCKVKLKEMFERSITLQPESPAGPAPAPEHDPLDRLPDFNVYSQHAPELHEPDGGSSPDGVHVVTGSPGGTAGRRVSMDSALTATSSASARRTSKIMESVSGNGQRRAFRSPDGKVEIKLTSFRPPSSAEVGSTTYVGAVTNPRSKSPAVVRTLKDKKKQEDDYVKAIVAANRKAAAEKMAADRLNRRRSGPAGKTAAYTPKPQTSSQLSGSKLTRGAHIAASSPQRRPSISPNRYRPIAELDLFHVAPHTPGNSPSTISFHSFVKMLWEVAASYMDLPQTAAATTVETQEQDPAADALQSSSQVQPASQLRMFDAHAMRALRAFVHVHSRYRARLTTKEVEKVLPLLTHDQDLRHKATRLF